MKVPALLLIGFLFVTPSLLAKNATLSDIYTASGFLNICGADPLKARPDQVEEVASSHDFQAAFSNMLSENANAHTMCLSYVQGIYDGWKEGRDYGVLATVFPDGIPKDTAKEYDKMSAEELKKIAAAMNFGGPCVPDHSTVGQFLDSVVDYVREQTKENGLLVMVPMSRLVMPALLKEFACGQK